MSRMQLKGKKLQNPPLTIEEDPDEQGPYDSLIFENDQVEPDMSPLPRHEFETTINRMVKNILSLQNIAEKDRQDKFEIMKNAVESATTDTKKLRIETAANFESSRQYQTQLYERANTMTKGYNSLNERANNLEMKLRKRGYLSKFHAIDYVPFIKLPDKSKYGGTRTTITNKYIVS